MGAATARLSAPVRSATVQLPNTSLPTLAAADFCIPGATCEYRSSAMLMFAWPRRSLTTLGKTPASSSNDACVCRRS